MTPPSGMKLVEDNKYYLLTETSSPSFILPLSCPMESNLILPGNKNLPFPMEINPKITSVDDLTPQMTVPMVPTVNTNTSVATAGDPAIIKTIVTARAERIRGLQPKYLRYNFWSLDSNTRSTAEWTEFAYPLPSIPHNELHNPIVTETIAHNPSLFKIVTPINVNQFEFLLQSHPNQAFVQSVCKGLCEGFCPWANTLKPGYPTTHDASLPTPTEKSDAAFLHSQKDLEVQKERFLPSFGTKLLPGMYSMPIHAVPKPHSTDMRMVTDQSAGSFSLNSMILCSDIMGFPLDNMKL